MQPWLRTLASEGANNKEGSMKALCKIVGMATVVAIVGLADMGTVAAQELDGEWKLLTAGESQWYSFEYLGDGSQIKIRMDVDSVGGTPFSVWTPEQMQLLSTGAEVEPVG
jgi:hypothetical protein